MVAGADVSEPLFNLYEHFTLTLDEIPQQRADGSGDLDTNHAIKLVLSSALPDLEIGLALVPYQTDDSLVDVRSTVLITKYGKGVTELTMTRERRPEIDFFFEDSNKITIIPLVRHSRGGDFTLTVLSTSSNCQVNVFKATKRAVTSIKGKWSKETAGGGLEHVTWRKNPHYLMTFPKKENRSTTVTLILVSLFSRYFRV